MKQKICIFAAAALLLVAAVGCDMNTDGPEVRKVSFDIASFMERGGEVSTKMTMTEDNKYLWQASDSVGIYPNAGSQIFFAVGSGAGTSSVSFDGGGWAFRRGYTYQSYYPFIKDFDLKRNHIPVSFTGQVQNGNNNRDHAGKYIYMYTLPASAEVGDLNFAYKHLCAVMKARVTLPKGSYSALKVASDEALFATEGYFDLTADSPKIIPTKMSKTLNLKLTNVSFDESTELVAYVFAYPAAIKGEEIRFTVFDDKGNQFSYTVTAKYDLEASYTDNFRAEESFPDPEAPTGDGQMNDIDIDEFDWDSEGRDIEWPRAKYPNDEPDLSKDGTANCYAALPGKSYSFKATVKGNSNESLDGTPVKAETLWESYGTATTPNVGDVVKDVTFSNGRVSFTTVNEGNAVITVRDSEGTILWSWHIWVTDADLGGSCQLYYGGNVMMDRNLGALSATPGDVGALGLLYQWGRKDPFLGSSSISSNTLAKSTVTEPSPVSSDVTTGTIEYATSHPNTYIKEDSYNYNYDWYYTGDSSTDNTRWNSDKGVYDPCPPGWRVPDGGDDGVWARAGFSDQSYDGMNEGMLFNWSHCKPSAWYPAAGCRVIDGSLGHVGYGGDYWSCTPISSCGAYHLRFNSYGSVYPTNINLGYRALGQSVRCQSE